MYLHLLMFLFAFTLIPPVVHGADKARLAARQVYECGARPVDCGGGWCCQWGEKCHPAPNDGMVCVDLILTNADGSPWTDIAYNPASFLSIYSINGIILTLQSPVPVATTDITQVSLATTSSRQGSVATTTVFATPAVTSTVVPHTSASPKIEMYLAGCLYLGILGIMGALLVLGGW